MMIGLRLKVREILLPSLLAGAALLSGCFAIRTPSGGGQTTFKPPRIIRPADIALLPGYQIEPVATGLIFPTGVTFDDQGGIYVVESGCSYGEVWAIPRMLRIDPGKEPATIAAGSGKNGPWNGVAFHRGSFYIAEGGVLQGGRVIRVRPEGAVTPLIENLPGGLYGEVSGPDGGRGDALFFRRGDQQGGIE